MRKGQCPKCRAAIFIEQDFGGKVTCSQCGTTLTARPKAAAAPAPAADDEYRIAPVEESKAPPPKASSIGAPAASAPHDDFALAPLETGKPEAGVAAASGAQPSGRRCPNCDIELAPGAVLCVQCGYDFRQGVKMRGVVGRRGPVLGVLHSQNAIVLCAGTGFLLGIILAVVLSKAFGAISMFEVGINVFAGIVLGIVLGGGIGYVLTPLLPRASSSNSSKQLGGMLCVLGGLMVTGIAIMCFGALHGSRPSGRYPRIVLAIYELFGAWGVLIILGGAGLVLIVQGIRQMLLQEE